MAAGEQGRPAVAAGAPDRCPTPADGHCEAGLKDWGRHLAQVTAVVAGTVAAGDLHGLAEHLADTLTAFTAASGVVVAICPPGRPKLVAARNVPEGRVSSLLVELDAGCVADPAVLWAPVGSVGFLAALGAGTGAPPEPVGHMLASFARLAAAQAAIASKAAEAKAETMRTA